VLLQVHQTADTWLVLVAIIAVQISGVLTEQKIITVQFLVQQEDEKMVLIV